MAAVLACGPGAVLSHRSAGQLWRIVPPSSIWPEVTRPRRHRAREGIVSHRSLIAPDEWEILDGIPVTSPFRTVFDVAATLEMRELERAFHEAEVRGLKAKVSLPTLVERYPGRRGIEKVATLLSSRQPVAITRNDFEEAFLGMVDANGLPRPRMNAMLSMRGRFLEIDALWEPQRLAVELDSRGVHGTHRNFQSDRRRDRILLAEGWRTMRVTWHQLRDEPTAIAADLRLALDPAAPTVGGSPSA
ncbi:MAG TPA: hypothetical protein VFN82_03075 [Solirubrobacterales bacterium]|nr:hypothetical protein [Solirubrobacterales bacterium]